jgi:hypothetical protein
VSALAEQGESYAAPMLASLLHLSDVRARLGWFLGWLLGLVAD